jgi:tetratricopeptide (TPR) repeat protein
LNNNRDQLNFRGMRICAMAFRAGRNAAVVLVLAGAAHAEGEKPDTAYRAAIEEAITAFASSDLARARVAFERAHALSPSARTYRGLGLTDFRGGDYVAAAANLRAALNDARKALTPEQRDEATRLLARAEALTGHVIITASPASATIRFDGKVVQGGHEFEVATGTHVVSAELAGYERAERQQDVPPAAPTTIELELASAPPVREESRHHDPSPAPAVTAYEQESPRFWTWIALGAAPVFAGAGLGIWLSGLSDADRIRNSDYTPAQVQEARERAGLHWKETWSTVGYVAGGVALGTGAILYFVEGAETRTAPRVSFAVTGTGAHVMGRF